MLASTEKGKGDAMDLKFRSRGDARKRSIALSIVVTDCLVFRFSLITFVTDKLVCWWLARCLMSFQSLCSGLASLRTRRSSSTYLWICH